MNTMFGITLTNTALERLRTIWLAEPKEFQFVAHYHLCQYSIMVCHKDLCQSVRPLPFHTIYKAWLNDFFSPIDNYHLYADDIQLYNSISYETSDLTIISLGDCVNLIKKLMIIIKLQLNYDKNEFIVFKIKGEIVDEIFINECLLEYSTSVKNLAVFILMNFRQWMIRSQYFVSPHIHFRNINRSMDLLEIKTTKLLINFLFTSRLDYWNSHPFGYNRVSTWKVAK